MKECNILRDYRNTRIRVSVVRRTRIEDNVSVGRNIPTRFHNNLNRLCDNFRDKREQASIVRAVLVLDLCT